MALLALPFLRLTAHAGFFRVLGVAPVAGRTFLDEEGEPGHDNRVVLVGWRSARARGGCCG